MGRQLVLASGSRWRQALLERLALPHRCAVPAVDESPLPGEPVAAMASRLALAKARAVAGQFPDAIIIGSDQAAAIDGRLLGKPGDHATAATQLQRQSGRRVDFHTALCLLDARTGQWQARLETTRVQFRPLSAAQIDAYLRAEQPWDCAGSFRSEGLGIALLAGIDGRDPTALVGLPLMALCELLQDAGVDVLTAQAAGPAG